MVVKVNCGFIKSEPQQKNANMSRSSRQNVKNGRQKKNRVRKWKHVISALMQKVKNQEKLIFQQSRTANPRASSSTDTINTTASRSTQRAATRCSSWCWGGVGRTRWQKSPSIMSSLTIQLQPPCILMLSEYAASNKLDLPLIPWGIEKCEVIGRI